MVSDSSKDGVVGAELLLIAALSCPVTTIRNDTSTWTDLDKKTLDRAKTRCVYFYPASPCLKLFWKPAERQYRALCAKGK